MAKKYYSAEEAAEVLGVSQGEINQMRERQELRGYRDGAQWKFKVEDVEQAAGRRAAPPSEGGGQDESDVVLSELELGPSGSGGSGTVIGGPDDSQESAADSDLKLAEDAQAPEAGGDQAGSKASDLEELDLALEEDVAPEGGRSPSGDASGGGDSSVDVGGKDLEDDDLVLGGSGGGSDITIGGDSGISLVDPADSGLSLEEPLETGGGSGESLELGEDDMISVDEPAKTDSPTEVKSDDDFLLTPLEETGDEEDSESGSQVIALDLEEEEGATMAGDSPGGSAVAAMLDEDVTAEPGAEADFPADAEGAALEAAPMGTGPAGFAEGAPVTQAAALPEAPYTGWNILSLSVCSLVLILAGMMMYDLVRNMWSWDGVSPVNSPVMELILGLF